MTPYPAHGWMEQQARNATMEEWGFLRGCRYLLHDRDTKFCASFRELIGQAFLFDRSHPALRKRIQVRAPCWQANRFDTSRFVHEERNHQSKENLILFPVKTEGPRNRKAAVQCRERLGGLLKYYERKAA